MIRWSIDKRELKDSWSAGRRLDSCCKCIDIVAIRICMLIQTAKDTENINY